MGRSGAYPPEDVRENSPLASSLPLGKNAVTGDFSGIPPLKSSISAAAVRGKLPPPLPFFPSSTAARPGTGLEPAQVGAVDA